MYRMPTSQQHWTTTRQAFWIPLKVSEVGRVSRKSTYWLVPCCVRSGRWMYIRFQSESRYSCSNMIDKSKHYCREILNVTMSRFTTLVYCPLNFHTREKCRSWQKAIVFTLYAVFRNRSPLGKFGVLLVSFSAKKSPKFFLWWMYIFNGDRFEMNTKMEYIVIAVINLLIWYGRMWFFSPTVYIW